MHSLIRKSAAVLLSILTLLPSSSTIASPKDKPPKDKPLRLMDSGMFGFTSLTSATLSGTGLSTHMGKIVSGGNFTNEGALGSNDCPNGFFGSIDGTATAANGDTLNYSVVKAKFCPDPDPSASGVFHGVGTYEIKGGSGRFAKATGSGDFIGIADFKADTYNCLLSGTISY